MAPSRPFFLSIALCIAGGVIPPQLTDAELADAVALGKRCKAPIVHFETPEYDLYVESPFAHAALITAVAVVNHESVDAPGVRNAMTAPAAIWLTRKFGVAAMPTLDRIAVQPLHAVEIRATAERRERLFAGTLPSHGIVDNLRTRLPQYEFSDLPAGDYDVVVHLENGVRRHRVTASVRASAMDVCNKWM